MTDMGGARFRFPTSGAEFVFSDFPPGDGSPMQATDTLDFLVVLSSSKGPRHDEFWSFCAHGELRLQRCGHCGHICWPVADACEHCGKQELVWTAMSGRGKIVNWCSFEYDYHGGAIALPYDAILVELEEGPLFTSNPKGFGFDDIGLGTPVKLAFQEGEDATGLFLLPVFEKA
jgi:uncharacterized OB-fold protein